ncbi:MAG: YraN family protein [Parcubacteria group bacterium]
MRLVIRSASLPTCETYYQALGRIGERIAFDFVRQHGYEVVDQHVTAREGELDLIALDRGEFVFIEVKTRRSRLFGEPEYALTPFKLRRIRRAIAKYIQQHDIINQPYRLDCICIVISHFRSDVRHYIGCG